MNFSLLFFLKNDSLPLPFLLPLPSLPSIFKTTIPNSQTLPFLENLGGGIGGMNSVTGGMGMGLDRMSSSFDRMGPGIGAILERSIDMDRGFLSGPMGSGMRDRIGSKGNQIFVRNVSN